MSQQRVGGSFYQTLSFSIQHYSDQQSAAEARPACVDTEASVSDASCKTDQGRSKGHNRFGCLETKPCVLYIKSTHLISFFWNRLYSFTQKSYSLSYLDLMSIALCSAFTGTASTQNTYNYLIIFLKIMHVEWAGNKYMWYVSCLVLY